MYISHSSKIPGQPRDELLWEEEEEEEEEDAYKCIANTRQKKNDPQKK